MSLLAKTKRISARFPRNNRKQLRKRDQGDVLNNYKTKINEYEPKFIKLLEKSLPIKKVIWDENLAIN